MPLIADIRTVNNPVEIMAGPLCLSPFSPVDTMMGIITVGTIINSPVDIMVAPLCHSPIFPKCAAVTTCSALIMREAAVILLAAGSTKVVVTLSVAGGKAAAAILLAAGGKAAIATLSAVLGNGMGVKNLVKRAIINTTVGIMVNPHLKCAAVTTCSALIMREAAVILLASGSTKVVVTLSVAGGKEAAAILLAAGGKAAVATLSAVLGNGMGVQNLVKNDSYRKAGAL